MSSRFRWRGACVLLLLIPIGLLSFTSAGAQSALASAPTSAEEAQSTGLELYTAPKFKQLVKPDCNGPGSAPKAKVCKYLGGSISEYHEGWAQLEFMVDRNGKPYEVSVVRSTGDAVFEQAAIASIEASKFDPATLDGKPVESELSLQYVFGGGRPSRFSGATREFAETYEKFTKAVDAGDRVAADAEIKKFVITNLYEDAFEGLAQYNYAAKWGTREEQLEGIWHATANVAGTTYLPPELFARAQRVRFDLCVDLGYYGEAVELFQAMQKRGLQTESKSHFQAVVAKLDKIKTDDTAYSVAGDMPKGDWFIKLFKRHFQVEVLDGAISQVKLRCQKRYVYFDFDPKLQYEVSSKQGQCSLELDGTPNTRFKLTQF